MRRERKRMVEGSISPLWRRLEYRRQSILHKGEVAARLWHLSTVSEILKGRLSIFQERARLYARLVGGEDPVATDMLKSIR